MKRILERIGFAGVAAIGLLAAALFFSNFMVKPLQEKNLSLTEAASRSGRKADNAQSGEKVAAVYEYLRKEEDTTDWLAKLHGIGTATGVQLRSASYRTQPTDARIVRYEIVLPVSGSYGQIRDFLKRAAAEIPVMSIDQITLKKDERKGATPQAALHAEMRLTLHMVKS
jgi:Tfp pilus assembly protein PilO